VCYKVTFEIARKYALFFILLFYVFRGHSQLPFSHNPELLKKPWGAQWITHPMASAEGGVFLFRKEIELGTVPEKYIIHISADNRYKLYVNGKYISHGPARGDLRKWRFESIDLAPHLTQGENIIGVRVWNLGAYAPVAQFSVGTGLIVQGDSEIEEEIKSDDSWKVMQDTSSTFFPITHLNTYYVTGPSERFETSKFPRGWLTKEFQVSDWENAKEMEHGTPFTHINEYGGATRRALYPREIPPMELKHQSFKEIRRTVGINNANGLINDEVVSIPANSEVSILLDHGVLTNAYPKLIISGGEGAKVKITYAESLFEKEMKDGKEVITRRKGHRDKIEGKEIFGNYDSLLTDGSDHNVFESLWWRTFRYVQLDITTNNEPLEIERFTSTFSGYPLEKKAQFAFNDPLLEKIETVSWRTQRLCAGESFFDTPYYEQIQYIGDTRIQGLITFYASGDTTLWKKAIQDFYDSRLPAGLTQSRYPANLTQLIPPFSLLWIGMVNDYFMHTEDKDFVKSMLPAIMEVLNWFEKRTDENQISSNLEGWNFVDWVTDPGWEIGVPCFDDEGRSSIVVLHYVYGIQKAAELFDHFGWEGIADEWLEKSEKCASAIYDLCWDESKKMLANTPNKKAFSQHGNILGVLTGTIPSDRAEEAISAIYNNDEIAQASYYFTYYLIEAMNRAGMAERYLETLGPWNEMLENGLTTFIEQPDPSRSDCHAWSASPLYFFYSLVAGIKPGSPGFKTVDIAPKFGNLDEIEASIPFRSNDISIALKKKGNEVKGKITLPEGLKGNFVWEGEEIKLNGGINAIKVSN